MGTGDRTRRQFLRDGLVLSAGMAGLSQAGCASGRLYGPPQTDPDGLFELPSGFEYTVLSRTGETMSDGLRVPAAHDGMGAFAGPNGTVILVRNHELMPDRPDLSSLVPGIEIPRDRFYDYGRAAGPNIGGTTTVVYDPVKREVVRHFQSLIGTQRNCAGGKTPWGSWISCEESVSKRGELWAESHGYCFEVPATATPGLVKPVPLRALGRFNHEAVAIDPRLGIVYLTEDRADSLLYRFIPDFPNTPRLVEGGKLQALRVRDQRSLDTRNWPDGKHHVPVGARLAVDWVDLRDVTSPNDDLRIQGRENGGAAMFARGEGIWWGADGVYFSATVGGPVLKGQIWRYSPRAGILQLLYESSSPTAGTDPDQIELPDNLCVAPWGDLFVCEDGPAGDRLMRFEPGGKISVFGRNIANDSEIAGVTFSPSGDVLFANLQFPGLTLAIHGPF